MAFREMTLTEEEQKALGGKFWKPAAIGDKLGGYLLRYQPRVKDFNDGEGPKTLHTYYFKNKDGEVSHDANNFLHTLIQKAMRPESEGGQGLKANAGHAVVITYTFNTPPGKSGKGFKIAVDTNPIGGQNTAPPPQPKPAPVEDDDIPF